MLHPNARLTVHGRLALVLRVESGWSVTAAARASGVSRQTASKWVGRYRESGQAGLADASSRPVHTRPAVSPKRRRRIINARLTHRRGPHWLAALLGIARSTIYAVLRRYGLSRIKARAGGPVLRYEWPCPGDLVHLDIKKLGRIGRGGGKRVRGVSAESRTGRGLGWDFVHVAIDDHSRLAYAEICPDERAETTVAFTSRALGFFESAGVVTRRVITDNGAAYRSLAFTGMLKARGIEVKKTRPYRPQTNGKAEAFVKIVTNEWAYGASYSSNAERAEMLGPFLDYYNRSRPHGGIGFQPPISRVE